ncbi:glycogen synthase GlgA [Sphingobium sufflavum]|uniref:glycogen synthase GlgA n=1 Tax=Sphingobium sufflavum TaxID=1129547 RepID=UPI001F1E1034|nr:glycogen synthase GlgA [Sphingobium sufflavum]MCE7798625.1 glycogen synthase GlgA [Sphingobium sufflavum]
MKLLAVASEIHPLIKTGGLADVVGALPAALSRHGWPVITLVPGYPAVMKRIDRTGAKGRAAKRYPALFGVDAKLIRASYEGRDLLILDAPGLYDREGGPYLDMAGHDWTDNWRRYAALAAVGADLAAGGLRHFQPDVVHVHDWQAALTLAYMRHGRARHVPGVLTIHNLAFQGRFEPGIFPALGLPDETYSVDGVEYYGGVGYLKAGIQYADAITTVSPSYAREITTGEWGMGLDGLLRARGGALHGIVNGIDTQEWNPSTDADLAARFTAKTIGGRARNRAAVEKSFGLDSDGSLLVTIVSRLTWQKGMDILASQIDAIAGMGIRIALLGAGDAGIEGQLLAAASRHRGRIGLRLGYDEAAAHLLQGGADAILIPSRTEPCGLTQLYGLRYGCVPIVARTGGLADTVIDANEAALGQQVATGVQFGPLSADSLLAALARAQALHADAPTWAAIQRAGMTADFSWDRSAARYAALFGQLVAAKRAAGVAESLAA